jgi:hypothetical protein
MLRQGGLKYRVHKQAPAKKHAGFTNVVNSFDPGKQMV